MPSLATLPDTRATEHPDSPALTDDHNGALTNTDMLTRVQIAAATLAQFGVGPGDVVAVKLPNRTELVIAMFAAWRLGAAATPVNPWLTNAEVEHQLADCNARVLISDDDTDHGVTKVSLADLVTPTTTEPISIANPADGDVALLIYTSGTTGRPKGVELTHHNLMTMTQTLNTAMEFGDDEHSLLILPLFHVNAIVVSILAPLLAGGQATIAGRFHPATFFDTVEKVRPTYFSAVPTIYAMLAVLPPELTPDTSSVRYAACGAAPMPVNLIEAFETRYGIPIIEGYGLSESTCASTSNPLNGIRKPGTVGLPLPGITIGIMGVDGQPITDGATGEVVISGPTVMRGYLGRPDETEKTLKDGWLHTGDVGFLDADGYLTLVDRVKDMIIRGGENIYPKEIETIIYTHPDIHEAAVVGRPDDVYGQVPVAFVSLKPNAQATVVTLDEHLRQTLAKYKLPEIVIVDSLPKNPVGKLDKPALRVSLSL